MQRWTKKRPNSVGYWWALDDDISRVCQIITIWDEHSQKDILHCYTDDEYIQLCSNYFNNWLWGSSKLTEPAGEKI